MVALSEQLRRTLDSKSQQLMMPLGRYRAELDAQPDILEIDKSPAKVLPSERREFWQVFTREQEKQLTEYLKAASLMNHGLTGLSTRKLAL